MGIATNDYSMGLEFSAFHPFATLKLWICARHETLSGSPATNSPGSRLVPPFKFLLIKIIALLANAAAFPQPCLGAGQLQWDSILSVFSREAIGTL